MKKENLIAHIESLDELKPYICPKAVSVRDWEFVCQECKGKCDAGKRAVELLNIANKPYFPEKNGGRGIVTAKMLAGRDAWNELQHERTVAVIRKVFSKAINDNRNPAEVLAENEGIDVTVARKRIDYWIKKYPDLDKELNMKVIMDRYVKRRKRRTSVLSEEAFDEVSIGDILKATGEGRVKVDSVEETESGVHIQARIVEPKSLSGTIVQVEDDSIFKEAVNGVKEQLRAECDSANIGEGSFTVDNPSPCEVEPVPFSPCQMFSDGEGDFYTVGDTSEAVAEPNDNVNRPGHYTFGTIEVIDYIRDKMTPEMFQGFCMGNVLKYVSRHKHKNGVEDLKKANVYLGWLIESEEGAE